MITSIDQFKEQAEKNYKELRNVPSKYTIWNLDFCIPFNRKVLAFSEIF